jgi:hypothetical protein
MLFNEIYIFAVHCKGIVGKLILRIYMDPYLKDLLNDCFINIL